MNSATSLDKNDLLSNNSAAQKDWGHLLFAVAVGAMFSGALTLRHHLVQTSSTSFASSTPVNMHVLGELWTSATEFMLQVPNDPPDVADGSGSMVVLVPSSDVARIPHTKTLAVPTIFHHHSVFALTAFDPPGVSRSLEDNTVANARLLSTLRKSIPMPTSIWRSFGVSLAEGWREDGFCMAFKNEHKEIARAAVVKIAIEFEQGAIFEYAWSMELGPSRLTRYTIPAAAGSEVAGTEEIVRVAEPPILPQTLDRDWAGPSDLG